MQRRSLAGFGLGVTLGVAACALLTTGAGIGAVSALASAGAPLVSGSSVAGRGVDALVALTRPPAAAGDIGLPAFESCERLRRWYVDAALPAVGPWGFAGPVRALDRLFATMDPRSALGSPVASTAGRAPIAKAVGSSATGTNVQEAGVDEPDVAKTDGHVVVRVTNHHLVVTDVRGATARQRSRIELPGPRTVADELLLIDDTVLVLGQEQSYGFWGPGPAGRASLPMQSDTVAVTHLSTIDISSPGAPRILSHQRIDGGLGAAREYGDGTVRVAVETGYPVLDFVVPNRDRSRREATRLNRRIVRDADLTDWLPGIHRGDGAGRQPLVDCTDVRHPRTPSGFGTISLLTLGDGIGDGIGTSTVTAITAAGDLVYSSTDRLYVATMRSGWWQAVEDGRSGSRRTRLPQPRTTVHAFDLADGTTTYSASGTVPGSVRDRWSFDEHDGMLRVATALGRGWRPRENAVSVLEQDGDRLRVVGSVAGLGKGESIESVRWFDDLAVVVTFRQTDPLYTVDLSSPRTPRLLGALKVPGFSAYLHPVGDDVVLGVGQDATRTGSTLGGQVSSFDLSDRRHVTRVDTHGFGPATAVVDREPRAFTFLPQQRLAFVVVEHWRTGDATLTALHVDRDGALRTARSWDLDRWSGERVRTLPLDDGRVAVVDRQVRILHLG